MIFTTNEKYEQAILSTLIHIQTHLESNLNLDMLAERAENCSMSKKQG
jgi:hypothetical protein